VIVVWLFLRDWRATFVSAVALPMSVIPAFIGMYLLGFSVNVMTLLALSLVIGILVDDAIVEVENIVRHLRMGKTPFQAAMEAADEIGLAVIATTFTLIAVFLPTAFMSGIAGKFFKQFGWTAALAVFASLVVARVLTPMMAAYILKPAVGAEKEPAWLRCVHARGGVEHPQPLQDDGAGHAVLLRFAGPDSAAADRLHPAGRQLADAGLPVAAHRAPRWRRPRRIGGNTPPRDADRPREERLHHHRRRQRGRRPVRQASARPRRARPRSPSCWIRAATGRASRCIENQIRAALKRCPACAARWAWAARARSTSWC
jgi:hypothetical protein